MKTCYVYFYDGYISVAPTIIGTAKILSKYFEKVVIFAQKTHFKKYEFKEKNIEVKYIFNSFYWKKSDKPKNFANKVKKMITFTDDDWFLGIDDTSLEPALEITKGKNAMFLSLEIPPNGEKLPQNHIEMFNKMKVILVQNDNRLEILKQAYDAENIKENAQVIYIPNNSIPEKSEKKLVGVVEQFRDLPEGKTICTSIGMVEDSTYSLEIAKAFSQIDNAVLIYHNRSKIHTGKPYIREIINNNRNNLYLSKCVYDFKDIEYAYKGVQIGIACYKAVDENYKLVGNASGKLCFYSMYKIPVLVNRMPGLADLVEKYNCGVVIDDVNNTQEWKSAIDKINADYEGYSARAYELFKQELDFNEKIKPFEEFLEKQQ